ncbi:hypothetical protein GCM10027294_43510 [Marinactinospora endophytica]
MTSRPTAREYAHPTDLLEENAEAAEDLRRRAAARIAYHATAARHVVALTGGTSSPHWLSARLEIAAEYGLLDTLDPSRPRDPLEAAQRLETAWEDPAIIRQRAYEALEAAGIDPTPLEEAARRDVAALVAESTTLADAGDRR